VPDQPLQGVIEGFYGREWSWASRHDYADFLASLGLNAYIYCPKGDAFLRKRWREAWPVATADALAALAGHFRAEGIGWGVGLSPFALYEDYSAIARASLRERVRHIDELGGSILAILFDDMPGDLPELAARQCEIMADVRSWSSAEHLLVCPTYYSLDPVLEQHFGARPDAYWSELGAGLSAKVDVFWTGNRVCSESIAAADLAQITRELGRPPVLWDNYPVNDGAMASKFLHLSPLSRRAPDLPGAVRGHFCNPMNQAELSKYPLSGLATLYGGGEKTLVDYYPDELVTLLQRDQDLFERAGLDNIGPDQSGSLAREYAQLEHPAAAEVAGWLRGEYTFDPACLTG
jgi:hypothetical protein